MKRILLLTLTYTVLHTVGMAQEDVILKAMQDELDRNLTQLHDKDFEKPFFIAYTISDNQVVSVSASLGALVTSNENKQRFKNVRVLVGDYDFNDESLDNNTYSAREENEIALPLDNDYYGIRRSLWATTDYVYKSAARQYKENLETRKEKQAEGEFHHRKFAKAPMVKLIHEITPLKCDRKALESLARDLSAVFLEYPTLEGSAVYFSVAQTVKYIVNSEGTIARIPEQICTIQIFGGLKRETGEEVYDQLSYSSVSVDKMPSKAELTDDIRKLCQKLLSKNQSQFEDEYTGPVLFTDIAVADLFAGALFGFRERLIANDMIPDPKSNRKETGMESKLEKPVVSELITVKAKTPLREYAGQDVFGGYEIDDEGVQPDKELTLIEHGILKNLLNDRSVVHKAQVANGHNDGPGVVEVTLNGGLTLEQLKKKLIESAKAEGLDFGIMVKTKLRAQSGTRDIYKVYVKDGREELVQMAAVDAVVMKNLKKGVYASNDMKVHSVPTGPSGLVSYIVPSAILLHDIEVKKVEIPGYKHEVYVTSPLLK